MQALELFGWMCIILGVAWLSLLALLCITYGALAFIAQCSKNKK